MNFEPEEPEPEPALAAILPWLADPPLSPPLPPVCSGDLPERHKSKCIFLLAQSSAACRVPAAHPSLVDA